MDFMKNEQILFPRIDVFWTGAHHHSSVAVRVNTKSETVIFSNCFFRNEHISAHRLLGINENMYEALEAYALIREESDILVPMYDPRVLEDQP